MSTSREERVEVRFLAAAARQAALTWWATQNRNTARCDRCCRELAWGEGFLVAETPDHPTPRAWLVCDTCLAQRG